MRLLGIWLVLMVACFAQAVTDDAYHYIQTTTIPVRNPACLDSASDTLFGWSGGAVKEVQVYDGSSWSTAWSFVDSSWCTTVHSLWVDDNAIYIGFADGGDGGKLGRLARAPYALTFPLTFEPSTEGETDGRFILCNMAKTTAGSLFVGQYSTSGTYTDTAAYIYRSSTGEHWARVYEGTDRHMHGVWYDAYHDDLYAGTGDGSPRDRVLQSTDCGANWSDVYNGNLRSRITDMLFLYDRRIAGVDLSTSPPDTGVIWYTTDNSAYTDNLVLTGDDACNIFAMTMNADSVAFAGSNAISNTSCNLGVFRRNPWTETWTRVLDLGTATSGLGVICMTDFDSSGYAYLMDSMNTTLYKFRDAPVYTVGDTTAGADFGTIQYALTKTAPGDTLILMAGTHVASDDRLHHNMTLRGATQDNSLYTVRNAGATTSGIVIDSTSVVQDLTFTTNATISDGSSMLDILSGSVTCRRVTWEDCYGLAYATLHADVADRVRLIDCEIDHSTSSHASWGPVYTINVTDVIIDELRVHDCVTTEAAVFINSTSAMDTTMVRGSLFADNRSDDLGGALCLQLNVDSALSQVRNCTFDNNECADDTDGQLCLSNASSTIGVHYCIFTGADSTYALNNAGADTIRHCDAHGNLRNAFKKAGQGTPVFSDTLHIDPNYNSTLAFEPGYYQGRHSLIYHTTNNWYMGWEQWPGGDKPHPTNPRNVRRR